MNRDQLITWVKSVIYPNDNNEIDAQKHQDLEIGVIDSLMDAVASMTNGYLGTIRSDAPAPTPAKNGYYIFSTAGPVSYISGVPTVKVGDWLSVTYVGLNYTYTNVNKLLNLSDDYTVSDSNLGASLKALYDGLAALKNELEQKIIATARYTVEEELTANQARLKVPQASRRRGFVLARVSGGVAFEERYISNYDRATSVDSDWIAEANWTRTIIMRDLLDIGRYHLSGGTYPKPNARLIIPLGSRSTNFQLSYTTTDNTSITENYKGLTFSDSEWIKDNNWQIIENNNNKNVANGYAGLDAAKKLANDIIRTDFRMSQGYIFDGVDDYLSIAHNDKMNFGTDDFSIETVFTIKESSPTNDKFLVLKRNADSTSQIAIRLARASSGISNIQFNTVIGNDYKSANTNIRDGGTYHLIGVKTSTDIKLYINGVLVASTPITNGTLNNTGDLIIGKRSIAAENFVGNVSLVRLFNRALSQSDVTYYENGGRPDLQRLKNEDVITNYGELIPNGFSSSVGWYNPANILFEDNKAKFINKINANYISKTIVASLKRYRYKVGIESIDVGTSLGIGALGTIFTNIGIKIGETVGQITNPHFAISIVGVESLNAILNSVSVIQVGCVLELLPQNALPNRWLESQNGLDATTSGNPAINTESPITDTQIIDNITNNIAIGVTNRDYTLPAGYLVDSVCVKSTVSLTALQLVNVSTSETLITGKTVSSTAGKHLPITADQSSPTTDTTIRLNATGNTGLGFNIVINIKKCI